MPPPQGGGDPALPKFWSSPVAYIHPLTQNDQIRVLALAKICFFFSDARTNGSCHKFAIICVLLYILARSDVFAAMFRHDMEERRQVRTAMYIYLKQEGCVSLCEHNI